MAFSAASTSSKEDFKSKEWVHCFYCPKCVNGKDCLENEQKRKKCAAATRKDNLKRHTDKQHKGKLKRVSGEKKQSQLFDVLKKPRLSEEDPGQSTPEGTATASEDTGNEEQQGILHDTTGDTPEIHHDVMDVPLPTTPERSDGEEKSEFGSNDSSLKEKVDSLISLVKTNESKTDSKLDEIISLLKENQASRTTKSSISKEKETPSTSQSSAESGFPLLNAARTIEDILLVFTDLKPMYNQNKIVCTICEDNFKDKAKDRSEESFTFGVFKYDFEGIGDSFTGDQSLPREFRNLKSHIARHQSSDTHLKSVKQVQEKEQQNRKLHAKNARAGMTCGRLAYKIIYRGRPYDDYPTDVLIEEKNGGVVGDINHSAKFPRSFQESLYKEVKQRVCDYLHSPLGCTGKPPPCGILADKATMKRRTGQITGLVTTFPDADQMIQSLYLSNDIVKEHSGIETAKAIESVLCEFLDDKQISEQLVAGGFDGQYFHNSVPDHLSNSLNLSKAHFTHDLAHRMQLAEKDARNAGIKTGEKTKYYHEFIIKAMKVISDVLADIRFGKKFERLLEAMEQCPDDTFYKLDTFSTTRFAAYSARVFKAFVLDLKPIIIALEKRAEQKQANKDDAAAAQSLLNNLLSLKTMADLAGIADIYEELGKLSQALQKVNSFLWEKVDSVKKTIDQLTEMKNTLKETKSSDSPPQDKWPLLSNMWPKLLKNEFLPGTPINPQPKVRYVTRNASFNQENALPGLTDARRDIQDYLETLIANLEQRLLSDNDEQQLAENVRTLTSYTDLANLANSVGKELFVTRVLDQRSFWDACSYIVNLEVEERTITQQAKTFLHRLYPMIKSKSESHLSDKLIIQEFCQDQAMYDGIPDYMHCILSACIKGAIESVVESMGSKLEHHNRPERQISPETVNQAVFVAWNGPEVHHCDNVVRKALNRHFGNNWHFVMSQPINLYKVSQVVDNIQTQHVKFPMMH